MFRGHLTQITILTGVWLGMACGQATTGAKCSPQTVWMKNGLGQTPCLVASYLAGACNGSVYDIPALVLPGPYAPPQGSSTSGPNKCHCNIVLYNLLQACSVCQGGVVGSWSNWIASCGKKVIDTNGFPENTPDGTIIPGWAGLDPTKIGSWNATQAQQFEAVHPTASLTPSSPKTTSNTGAIVGGVVGGIALLILLGVGVFFYLRHRRRTREPIGDLIQPTPYHMVDENRGGMVTLDQGYNYGGYVDKLGNVAPPTPSVSTSNEAASSVGGTLHGGNSSATPATLKPYDPSDPSTFPSSTSPPSAARTPIQESRHLPTPAPAYTSTSLSGHKHGFPTPVSGYTGAAEV
ncbi:hypothetical protein FRB94_005567 [Tulasnella sp. JGI-2019a]|nr:hypothetical protein FRB94_005567 [Tulasnella sp. JGI-2019a]